MADFVGRSSSIWICPKIGDTPEPFYSDVEDDVPKHWDFGAPQFSGPKMYQTYLSLKNISNCQLPKKTTRSLRWILNIWRPCHSHPQPIAPSKLG